MPSAHRLTRGALRLEEIVTVLARHGLAEWLGRSGPDPAEDDETPTTPEARIRVALTELGTTFVKLGQMLSTRADLIGPELAAELEKLQASTPPDSPETVRATIEAELGVAPEELFASFEPEAAASASIGQVHRATLADGTSVIVKVQHPGIEDRVVSDLDLLAKLAELAAKHSEEARLYSPVELVEQFRRGLLRELDFGRELRNLERFRRHFEGDESIHFPRPYEELSTRRVLTMERFEGFAVSESERLAASGLDPSTIAERGAGIYLEMVFRDGFYHADPHPGNIWILDGGALGLLDAGMTGRLDPDRREEVEDLMLAAVNGDSGLVADLVLRLGRSPVDVDRDHLRAEIDDKLGDYLTQDLAAFDLSGALHDLTGVIRQFRIVLPTEISLLLKVLVMLEGTARLMAPRFNLASVLRPHYAKAVRRRLSPQRIASKLQRSYRDWDRLLDLLPRQLTATLERARKGSFQINLHHRRLDTTANRMIYGILCAALLLGGTQLWSRQIPPIVFGHSLPGVLFAMLAAALGLRLIRSIERSGGLGAPPDRTD